MTERNQVWKCEVCGNIVEILHAGVGQLVCCNQPMILLEAKRTEEGGYEKHLPVIERSGDTYSVKVGSVEHPMMEEHWIEWIALDLWLYSRRLTKSLGLGSSATSMAIGKQKLDPLLLKPTN
jgi:superoxide reductase